MKSSVTGVREDGASRDGQSANAVTFQSGQPFNPYRLFHGIFIPEALVRCLDLTPGAKIAYGRLVRYAGKDGVCHPRQETLAREIGVSARQVRSYLQELIRNRFLKVIRKGLHAPNEYVFLWHEVFNPADRKDTSGQERKDSSGQERKDSSGQERKNTSGPISRESIQESPFQESHPSSSSGSQMKTPPPTPAGRGGEGAHLFEVDVPDGQPAGKERSELEVTLDRVAASIHGRHPGVRRDCSVMAVGGKLAAILKYKRVPAADRVRYLESINKNHAQMCATEQWTKDGGEYAKGLENWLAPTKDRYEAAPAPAQPPQSRTNYSEWDPLAGGEV